MPKQYLNPDSLFPSQKFGFSQIVTATGGKTIYISGQTAWDVNRQIVGGTDLTEQTRQALRNIQTAVTEAGGHMEDVVSLRLYIVNFKPEQGKGVSDALKEFFPKNLPASTWVGVSCLAVPDFLIEIEATAVVE